MKKQLNKLSLKTDQILSMSKTDARQVQGGMKPPTRHSGCLTDLGCPSKYVCY